MENMKKLLCVLDVVDSMD